MIAFLWGLWAVWKSSIIKWMIYIGAAIALVGTVWFKGYNASQRKFRERQKEAKLKQLESKRRINETVRDLNDRRLDDQLSRWLRN